MIRAALALSAALFSPLIFAQASPEAAAWLSRMMSAAQGQSYSGTFVYQSGNLSETSRVVRVIDASGERERLEVLDGSPREVVRVNDEVRCYLPDEKRVIIERRGARRSFPALLADMNKGIEAYYSIQLGEVERVAGVDARQVQLDPKDAWRFGYRLWADVGSGLLIRARTVDAKGQMIEQFAFTQFALGAPTDPAETASRLQAHSGGWQVEKRDVTIDAAREGRSWKIGQTVPGFRQTQTSTRRMREGGPELEHVVFTDGLASVSLFVGVAEGAPAKPAVMRQGAVNLYSRRAGNLKITAVGEVPMATVRRFVEAVEVTRQ